MEKGGDRSSGFSVLDKKTSSSNSDFLSSMNKLQQSTSTTAHEPFPSKFLMMGGHHQQTHQLHPFVGDHDGGGGGTAGGAGAAYRDEVSSSDAGAAGKNTTILQPFDILHPSYSTAPYKPPAGGMVPFTVAQWKELERQAMIYKCMISSVPVPPHLLFPLSANFPVDSSVYGGRYCRKRDPEPGRCKRTDGKKWRCSREVAPLQKYCERHLHRGRPRSRKPVEVKKNINAPNHKKTRLEQTKTPPTVQTTAAASHQFVAANEALPLLKAKADLTISTPYYKSTTNRDLGLMMGSKQPWENFMEANMGMENHYSPSFDQDYAVQQQALNLFSYPNFPAPEIELQNGFIDAWSIDHNLNSRSNAAVSTSEGDLSPSLNLSMATAVAPVSWEPFARGGPLGEALQPGSAGGSNPASPYNSISTPATTVSSPSGVLHWTLFSHSDGSVCNSPTFAAPPPEISNQWNI